MPLVGVPQARRLLSNPAGLPSVASATHLIGEVPNDVSRKADAGSDSVLCQFAHPVNLLPVTSSILTDTLSIFLVAT